MSNDPPASPYVPKVQRPSKPGPVDTHADFSKLRQSGDDDTVDVGALIELAEAQAHAADYWFRFMWSWYLWLTGVGWVLSAVVPFGLALLLFVPNEEDRRILNIVMLLLSASSLSCLVLASVMRFKDRASSSRRIRNRLLLAVRRYWAHQLDAEGLFREVSEAYSLDADEAAP